MLGRSYVFRYLRHCFLARNTKGYGVHSPFLFDFTQSVILEKEPFYCFDSIEHLRRRLWLDSRNIPAGGCTNNSGKNKTVGYIARNCIKSRKYAQLLFRTASYLKARNILELGTSLGITTCYLAAASSTAECITMEQNPALLAVARDNFHMLGLENIRVVEGNIDDLLPLIISQTSQLDMVFMDAEHTEKSAMYYFEQCLQRKHNESVFIVDGIHRSDEMRRAWRGIRSHKEVTATIDLFEMGFVFFNKYLGKKNYRMRF